MGVTPRNPTSKVRLVASGRAVLDGHCNQVTLLQLSSVLDESHSSSLAPCSVHPACARVSPLRASSCWAAAVYPPLPTRPRATRDFIPEGSSAQVCNRLARCDHARRRSPAPLWTSRSRDKTFLGHGHLRMRRRPQCGVCAIRDIGDNVQIGCRCPTRAGITGSRPLCFIPWTRVARQARYRTSEANSPEPVCRGPCRSASDQSGVIETRSLHRSERLGAC